jgi:hypothetical protein
MASKKKTQRQPRKSVMMPPMIRQLMVPIVAMAASSDMARARPGAAG